ncbi:MAG: hypothetical protein OXC30_04600 [Alphaproteobacteria bacterium]|nr:hypothetical protein [Alphaproteobacteria bacterium]
MVNIVYIQKLLLLCALVLHNAKGSELDEGKPSSGDVLSSKIALGFLNSDYDGEDVDGFRRHKYDLSKAKIKKEAVLAKSMKKTQTDDVPISREIAPEGLDDMPKEATYDVSFGATSTHVVGENLDDAEEACDGLLSSNRKVRLNNTALKEYTAQAVRQRRMDAVCERHKAKWDAQKSHDKKEDVLKPE